MGLEPTTYGLQSRRSSQLSYIPSSMLSPKEKDGIELGRMGIAASVKRSYERLTMQGAFRRPARAEVFRLALFESVADRPKAVRVFLIERR
jgi:hypothetical protein